MAACRSRTPAADMGHVIAWPEQVRREPGFAASVGFEEGVAEFAGAPLRV